MYWPFRLIRGGGGRRDRIFTRAEFVALRDFLRIYILVYASDDYITERSSCVSPSYYSATNSSGNGTESVNIINP